MPLLSATECVTPAFRHMVGQMFQPFRLAFWLRMALLGLVTGEFAGEGFRGNVPTSFPSKPGTLGGSHGGHVPFPWHTDWFTPTHVVHLAIGVAIFFCILTLLVIYINSTLRFVLFDAVLHGDPRILAGWRKWRAQGRKFFVWQVFLVLVGWGLLMLCLVVPLLTLYSNHHIGFWYIDLTAVTVLMLGGLALMVLGIAISIAAILTKDFVVPMMALEGIGWQEGWQRLFVIARGHVSEYVIYFLMKIVLRILASLAHAIVMFLIVLLLAVPGAIAVIAGVAIGTGAAMAVKAFLITVGIVLGLMFLAVLIALSALVGAPVAFFFPAYAIYFFAGRYEPLGRIVFSGPPQPPPAFTPAAPLVPA
jgi:hypothetical protein